jgi:hypothetical protein
MALEGVVLYCAIYLWGPSEQRLQKMMIGEPERKKKYS